MSAVEIIVFLELEQKSGFSKALIEY